jgi:SecD/SecF fusion protein
VTRLIFDWMLDRNLLKSLPMLHLIRGAHFDFMRFAKIAFTASWILILVGVSYGLYRGKSALSVDFIGGENTILAFNQKVSLDQAKIRSVVEKTGAVEPLVQFQRDISTGERKLRLTTPFDTGRKAEEALKQAFPEAQFKEVDFLRVGGIVGKEIQKSAILASLFSLLGILIYVAFRYEFAFGVGAVVAVIHDVLMTIGWYCLAGREFNATTVAAILTIIGFSVNDTIVIFDRIREDLKLGLRGSFTEIINQALNQTLSRTLITSGTVFLSTMALYLFGGGAINDFAFAFLVGIITGTYSSIYIASALVLWWHKGEKPVSTSQVVVDSAVTARV